MAVAYDLPGLDTVEGIRRVLDIVVTDALGHASGIARLRVLISASQAAARLLEVGELEDRVDALEGALKARQREPSSEDGEPWSSHAA